MAEQEDQHKPPFQSDTQVEMTPVNKVNEHTGTDLTDIPQAPPHVTHQVWNHTAHQTMLPVCPPPHYGPQIGWPTHPCRATCPNCGHTGTTDTKLVIGLLIWAVIAIMLLFGLWLGCCFIPLCIPSLKDVEHHCASCGHLLGKRERMH